MANKDAEDDHLSVGVQLPNGQIQKPVSGQNLYWIKPGECVLNFMLFRWKNAES